MNRPALSAVEHRRLCLAAAEKLLRDREERYPALIGENKVTEAAADQALGRARALVAQWRWARDGSTEVPWDAARGVAGWGAYDFELAAELEGAAARARAQAVARPTDTPARLYADTVDALLWWQRSDHSASGVARIVLRTLVDRQLPAMASRW